MRFAAGFGSQIGLSFVRKFEFSGDRIDKQKLLAWNQSLAGTANLELRVLKNKLVAYVDGENNLHGGIQGEEYAVPSAEETTTPPVIVEQAQSLNRHLSQPQPLLANRRQRQPQQAIQLRL